MKIKDATHHINFYSVPTGTQLKDTDFLGKLSIILSYIQHRTQHIFPLCNYYELINGGLMLRTILLPGT